MMHGGGKSDEAVVAMKPANEVERSVEESVERRAEAKGNASQQSTFRAQNREDASQALERIRLTAHQQLPSHTRGGSRMRESRTYGSVRGACDETHVPTATGAGYPLCARQRCPDMAACRPRAVDDATDTRDGSKATPDRDGARKANRSERSGASISIAGWRR